MSFAQGTNLYKGLVYDKIEAIFRLRNVALDATASMSFDIVDNFNAGFRISGQGDRLLSFVRKPTETLFDYNAALSKFHFYKEIDLGSNRISTSYVATQNTDLVNKLFLTNYYDTTIKSYIDDHDWLSTDITDFASATNLLINSFITGVGAFSDQTSASLNIFNSNPLAVATGLNVQFGDMLSPPSTVFAVGYANKYGQGYLKSAGSGGLQITTTSPTGTIGISSASDLNLFAQGRVYLSANVSSGNQVIIYPNSTISFGGHAIIDNELVLNNPNSTDNTTIANGLVVKKGGNLLAQFGFNNNTNEAYVWTNYASYPIKFGTNNIKRMTLQGDGVLNLFTNGLTTSGSISCSSIFCLNSPLYVYAIFDMKGNSIRNVAEPVGIGDAATKNYVDSKTTSRSILHCVVLSGYYANLSSGIDHVKFNWTHFTRGSNISLDTSSPYTATVNVASLGRITLQPNRTYKLWGVMNNAIENQGSASYGAFVWQNADTNMPIGYNACAPQPNMGIDRCPGAGAVAFITPSVVTRVELRLYNSFYYISGTESGNYPGPAWCLIEEV